MRSSVEGQKEEVLEKYGLHESSIGLSYNEPLEGKRCKKEDRDCFTNHCRLNS